MENKQNTNPGLRCNSICFKCNNSTNNGCSWSKSFIPVEGWTATPDEKNKSYHIEACPEFIPEQKKQYCYEGCVNLILRLGKEGGKEYREARAQLAAAEKVGNPQAIQSALARFNIAKWFMEGYESDAGHDRINFDSNTYTQAELKKLFMDVVVNDPDKNSTDTKKRLANANYKAKIISAYRPCEQCIHYNPNMLRCTDCDFEHSNWAKVCPKTEKERFKKLHQI